MNKWEELDKKYIWHPFTQMKGWVENPQLVIRRGYASGNNQLSDVQTGKGRLILCQDFRTGQGLRMFVRQIQTDEIPGYHL